MKSNLRAIGLGLATLATVCVQPNTASAQGTTLDSIIYTASNATTGNAVLAFHREENGELKSIGSFPTSGFGTGAGLGSQGSVVLSQDQRWLYVVNAGSNDITVFAVEGNNLSKVSKVASGGNDPVSIAVDDDLLYVLNAKNDLIAAFGNSNRVNSRLFQAPPEPLARPVRIPRKSPSALTEIA